MEGKESLAPSDQEKAKRLREQVKEIDRDFDQRHLEVLNFIESEDRTTLDSEETNFQVEDKKAFISSDETVSATHLRK